MKRTLTIALLSLAPMCSTEEAHADVVSDRVFLEAASYINPTGCPTGTKGFRRIKQNPDGTQVHENVEFTPPAGSYFEITSVEYTTPYSTKWAGFYRQSLDIGIRQRVGTAGTSVFHASYQNQSVYAGDADTPYVEVDEVHGTGAQSRHAAFPVGPLMSSAARLCATATSNYWNFGGYVRVRGRLIPTGNVVANPGDTGSTNSF